MAKTNNLISLSYFLQTLTWPTCSKNYHNKCTAPSVIHRPDVAVIFEEPPHRPAYDAPFRAPLFIVEIEGVGVLGVMGNAKLKR